MSNKTFGSDFLQVLLALKDNTMKDIHANDIAIVTQVNGSNYICTLMSDENVVFSCVASMGLDVATNDVVLVSFCDTEFRSNLKRFKQGQTLQVNDSTTLHSRAFGVITNIIYRKEI